MAPMDHSTRLASETLLEIFHIAQDWNPIPSAKEISKLHGLTSADRTKRLLAWISLTHVCARWRSTALGDSSIWIKVPVVLGEEWLHEFLHRSGDQSITIDWRAWQEIQFPGLVRYSIIETVVVPNHYKRLRNFEAQLEAGELLFPFLSRSWPVLEELSVELSDFPQNLFLDHNAPRLRHLSFSLGIDTVVCTAFPWNAPFLRTLTILDLRFHEGITEDCMDMFLDTLASMTSLVRLRIVNSIPSVPGKPCPSCSPTERVLAVKLHTLQLRGTWDMMHHITHHIRPPSNCQMSFVVQEEEPHMGPYSDEIRMLCARVASYSGSLPGYEAVKFEFYAHGTVIRAFRTFTSLCSPPGSVNYHLTPADWYKGIAGIHPDIEIKLPPKEDDTALAFLDIMQGSVPNGIRLLCLDISDHTDMSSFLEQAHAALQVVHILQLNVNSERSLASSLILSPDAGSSVPFPELKVLDVHNCAFNLGQLLPYELPGQAPVPSLADTLHMRRTAGFPINIVHLHAAERIHMIRMAAQDDNETARDAAILREMERLEVMPGIRIIGEEEEVMYDDNFV